MRRSFIKTKLHNVGGAFKSPAVTRTLDKENTVTVEANRPELKSDEPNTAYFTVVYRKKQVKKHKTWDSDGFLAVKSKSLYILYSSEGKEISKLRNTVWGQLSEGEEVCFGGKEILVTGELSSGQFLSGRCFLEAQSGEAFPSSESTNSTLLRPFKRLKESVSKPSATGGDSKPLRHNPEAPNALVMPRVSQELLKRTLGLAYTKECSQLAVVVDPVLSSKLRLHQREGVRFLYECLIGIRSNQHFGAILADDMGLGKTLQTIAVLWTLLKQTPFPGQRPVLRKVLIVTPATLVLNWKLEFSKWLGTERIQVYAVDTDSRVADFKMGRIYSVMIVGYERLRLIHDELANANFDLIVCDEGHRLKSATIKTVHAIKSVPSRRRLLLSGTPIQNDLGEFYSMVDFTNPGVLGTPQVFKRVFEDAITTGRDALASPAQVKLCDERCRELKRLTSHFILRRTNEENRHFLPPKTEVIIFAPLTKVQRELYQLALRTKFFERTLLGKNDQSGVLGALTLLKKLCNSPALLLCKGDEDQTSAGESGLLMKCLQNEPDLDRIKSEWAENVEDSSSKMRVVEGLLGSFKAAGEKVVLVSNYTQTLDLLEDLCKRMILTYSRLDGTTPSNKRIQLVSQFNSVSAETLQVFLLSSKAGGTGINLVGASRLVLYDLDWNPSVDAQVMARIWRDGQKRPVFVYRVITVGTIEEKVFQRQLCKLGLSRHVLTSYATVEQSYSTLASAKHLFSKEELKDLFWYAEYPYCQTLDLLSNSEREGERVKSLKQELDNWVGYKLNDEDSVSRVISLDPALNDALAHSTFMYISTDVCVAATPVSGDQRLES